MPTPQPPEKKKARPAPAPMQPDAKPLAKPTNDPQRDFRGSQDDGDVAPWPQVPLA